MLGVLSQIADTYHALLGQFVVPASAGSRKSKPPKGGTTNEHSDIPGFCRSVTKAEIAEHGYVLTPGRGVGAEEVEEDDEPFEEKTRRLTHKLHGQFAESADLESRIRDNFASLGYDLGLGQLADVSN